MVVAGLGAACTPDYQAKRKEARQLLAKGQNQQALEMLRPLAKKEEAPADFHLLEGVAHFQQEQHQPAIGAFGQFIEEKPKDYRGYFNRGSSYLTLEDYQAAIEDFRQALKIKDTLDIRTNLAFALNKKGKLEASVEVLGPALQKDSSHFEARYNYANALLGLKQYQQAFYHFSWILDRDSTLGGAWYGAGFCLLMNKQRQEGCEALFKARLNGYGEIDEELIGVCEDFFQVAHKDVEGRRDLPTPRELPDNKTKEDSATIEPRDSLAEQDPMELLKGIE